MKFQVFEFEAVIEMIGVNPYVLVPDDFLTAVFEQAGKSKGPVPIQGTVNGLPYRQTLVKYAGLWRLYINTTMLHKSPERIGETIRVTIAYDPQDRSVDMPDLFREALEKHPAARAVFDGLSPSRRLEIVRYLASLKREETLRKNVDRAIGFLQGKERFVGRDGVG